MKSYLLKIFLCLSGMFILLTHSFSQQADNASAGDSEANILIANSPPTDKEISRFEGPTVVSRTLFEERLSFGILIFFFLSLLLEFLLIFYQKMDSDQGLKIIAITIIIGSSLFLVTAGYSNDQIAPIIGLLGTVAGYLLGNIKTKVSN